MKVLILNFLAVMVVSLGCVLGDEKQNLAKVLASNTFLAPGYHVFEVVGETFEEGKLVHVSKSHVEAFVVSPKFWKVRVFNQISGNLGDLSADPDLFFFSQNGVSVEVMGDLERISKEENQNLNGWLGAHPGNYLKKLLGTEVKLKTIGSGKGVILGKRGNRYLVSYTESPLTATKIEYSNDDKDDTFISVVEKIADNTYRYEASEDGLKLFTEKATQISFKSLIDAGVDVSEVEFRFSAGNRAQIIDEKGEVLHELESRDFDGLRIKSWDLISADKLEK